MHICLIYKNFPLPNRRKDTGIGTYYYNLASELGKTHTVTVITSGTANEKIQNKHFVIRTVKSRGPDSIPISLFSHALYQMKISYLILWIHRKHRINLLEFPNWEAEACLYSVLNRFLKIPIVVRLHTPTYLAENTNRSMKTIILHHLEKFTLHQPHIHITSSTITHARSCQSLFTLNNPVTIIPLGVPIPKTREYQVSKDQENIVLFVNRAEPRKGIDIFIKVISQVLSRKSAVKFVIIGSESGAVFQLIQEHLPQKFHSSIIHVGYLANRVNMNKWYQKATVCIVPSRYESFGLSVVEAMSFGKPVVASKIGGIQDIIKHKQSGILVAGLNPNKFASAIIALLDQPEQREMIGKEAYRTVKKNYSISNMILKTEKLYEQLSAKKQ